MYEDYTIISEQIKSSAGSSPVVGYQKVIAQKGLAADEDLSDDEIPDEATAKNVHGPVEDEYYKLISAQKNIYNIKKQNIGRKMWKPIPELENSESSCMKTAKVKKVV